jgi:hypothetical protein
MIISWKRKKRGRTRTRTRRRAGGKEMGLPRSEKIDASDEIRSEKGTRKRWPP